MKNIIKIIFIMCLATLFISIKDNYNYLFQTNLLNNNVEQNITKNTKYNPSKTSQNNF
ncbi:hypothetical protein GSH19_04190 [Lactobacillus sp. S2-2]|uniref:hypothetical protein n=1 Tax=Lactobacillus sp. S2-2 TaxID=2692917 RepID=UPI001F31C5F3|nr:hypothetical protein [Lactobacillus sp. S2-2]MCF6515355.1 hypothetical protein [Lactobacillus sp. S2-2]